MLKNKPSNRLSLKRTLLAIGGVIGLLAMFGVLYTVQLQGLEDLHTEPVCVGCSGDFVKYTLDWDNPDYWTEGTISNKIADVDGSGTEFDIKYSGKYNKLAHMGTGNTPNIQTFFSGGDHNALSHYVNPGLAENETIKITIQIKPAIPAHLGFELYHINGSWYSGDKVKVFAQTVLEGTKVYPSFTGTNDPSWEEDGPGTIDAIMPGETYANVAAGVNFNSSDLINKIVIEWSNCDICGTGVHGIGIGDMTFYSNANSLPVEWADFQVNWEGVNAQVSWQTAQELNNDYFTVERSVDGNLFEQIEKIGAIGNSSELSSYDYTDQSAKFAGFSSLYYRIKQTDIDGAFSYSSMLELAPNTRIPLELVVFPNPANDQVAFKLAGATENDFDYQILNTAGQLMESGQLQDLAEISFEVSNWPSGNYHVRFANNTQQVSKTFLVRH
ncbi:MAG: T9SS type A sorting domain-containing protein [Bacteroidia bacterium]